jgi:bla regulator protein blaR1
VGVFGDADDRAAHAGTARPNRQRLSTATASATSATTARSPEVIVMVTRRHCLTLGALLMLVCAATVVARAQTSAFEAASVKPNPAGYPLPIARLTNSGRFHAPNATLRDLIRVAYDLEDRQIVGGPGWMGADGFEVDATSSAATNAADARAMLRRLLADRFKLMAHTEKRETQGFVLVTAGRQLGRDMRRTEKECAPIKPPAGFPVPPPPPPPPGGVAAATPLGPDVRLRTTCGSMLGPGVLSARGMTTAQFVIYLSRNLERPVIDDTKLTGMFDIDLLFQPEVRVPSSFPLPPDAPSVVTAVQEQLGLKLDARRVPGEVLVIESVERPTEN